MGEQWPRPQFASEVGAASDRLRCTARNGAPQPTGTAFLSEPFPAGLRLCGPFVLFRPYALIVPDDVGPTAHRGDNLGLLPRHRLHGLGVRSEPLVDITGGPHDFPRSLTLNQSCCCITGRSCLPPARMRSRRPHGPSRVGDAWGARSGGTAEDLCACTIRARPNRLAQRPLFRRGRSVGVTCMEIRTARRGISEAWSP